MINTKVDMVHGTDQVYKQGIPRALKSFLSRLQTRSQEHLGFLNLFGIPQKNFKMYFSKIVQTAFLLALSVPAQAWNRLDKDKAVSHRVSKLLQNQS
jgi:hypothetical protein